MNLTLVGVTQGFSPSKGFFKDVNDLLHASCTLRRSLNTPHGPQLALITDK